MINTKINLITKKVDELIPYENNPRHNDDAVEPVSKSIQDNGYKVPIIIDGNNVIITGHTRLKALKKLGVEEIDCILADDLSEEQVKAFRLIDNKTSEFAVWDAEKLQEELANMNIDLSEFGFIETEDIDLSEFFEDVDEVKEKEPKKIQCPHCGEWIEV